MIEIEHIPHLPDRQQRLEALLVDCYGPDEERAALDVYCTDALQPPFMAIWRDPDEPGQEETVTVLGVARVDERRGVLLKVQRPSGQERAVLAEQLWAGDPGSVNATVLDDYRTGSRETDQGSAEADHHRSSAASNGARHPAIHNPGRVA